MDEIELIVFIIERGRGNELIKLASAEDISFSLLLHGRGTVNSEILNSLGLDGPEKDVVLLSAEKRLAEEKMNLLAEKLKLDKPGRGIAFMIPFSAAASQFMSYELLAGRLKNEKGTKSIGLHAKGGRRSRTNRTDKSEE